MPARDTICMSLGNWIAAFYVVYAMAAIALVSALAALISRIVSKIRAIRVAISAKVNRRGQVAQSRV